MCTVSRSLYRTVRYPHETDFARDALGRPKAKPGATVSDYMQNTLEFAEEVVVAERTFQGVSH